MHFSGHFAVPLVPKSSYRVTYGERNMLSESNPIFVVALSGRNEKKTRVICYKCGNHCICQLVSPDYISCRGSGNLSAVVKVTSDTSRVQLRFGYGTLGCSQNTEKEETNYQSQAQMDTEDMGVRCKASVLKRRRISCLGWRLSPPLRHHGVGS